MLPFTDAPSPRLISEAAGERCSQGVLLSYAEDVPKCHKQSICPGLMIKEEALFSAFHHPANSKITMQSVFCTFEPPFERDFSLRHFLSVCLSVCLSVGLSVCVCLSVCRSVSVCLSVCPSVRLCACLSLSRVEEAQAPFRPKPFFRAQSVHVQTCCPGVCLSLSLSLSLCLSVSLCLPVFHLLTRAMHIWTSTFRTEAAAAGSAADQAVSQRCCARRSLLGRTLGDVQASAMSATQVGQDPAAAYGCVEATLTTLRPRQGSHGTPELRWKRR